MSNQPQNPGPPPKFWDALPQIIDKLRNEFLLVTLGILIMVVVIGLFAPGVVDSLGRAFFYLLVILAWLAYVGLRVLDVWAARRPPPAPAQPRPQPPGGSNAGAGGTGEDAPPPIPDAGGAGDETDLTRLHQVLQSRFDREELRTLCFELGVSYDDLRGEGRAAKARELVLFMSRRTGGLARLRAAVEAARPGALG
jgi:hypothetical protein